MPTSIALPPSQPVDGGNRASYTGDGSIVGSYVEAMQSSCGHCLRGSGDTPTPLGSFQPLAGSMCQASMPPLALPQGSYRIQDSTPQFQNTPLPLPAAWSSGGGGTDPDSDKWSAQSSLFVPHPARGAVPNFLPPTSMATPGPCQALPPTARDAINLGNMPSIGAQSSTFFVPHPRNPFGA